VRATDGGTGAREVLGYTDSAVTGGAEHALMMLLSGLDRRRWRPVLVHHDHDGLAPLIDEARRMGVARWCIPAMPEGVSGGLAAVRFARRLRRRAPAVFHAHMSWPLACKWGMAAAILARVPAVVATVHLFVDVPVGLSRRMQMRCIAAGAGRYHAVWEDVRCPLLDLLGWSPQSVRVVPNGVELDRFVATPPPARAGGRPATALVPARLEPQKGHEVLLEAARSLEDVRFLLAGDGPLRPRLASLIRDHGLEDRVELLGRRDDIPALMASCDLVVLPSLYEGFPLSLLEAMAARRPIVATSAPGTRELVHDGMDGLLVTPGDAPGLARAFERLVSDPALADDLAAAGRRAVEDRFSSTVIVGDVAREYEELLDS
jgi:glycosyltransferase involved in cell wall biosynthesis